MIDGRDRARHTVIAALAGHRVVEGVSTRGQGWQCRCGERGAGAFDGSAQLHQGEAVLIALERIGWRPPLEGFTTLARERREIEASSWKCRRCASSRWVSIAMFPDGPRTRQCVPCGYASGDPA